MQALMMAAGKTGSGQGGVGRICVR
jgi:hypothetical protein